MVREAFHGELSQLGAELAGLCKAVCSLMERAMRALLDADLVLAEQTITDDGKIHQTGRRVEEHAHTLLALQSPVAKDLRTVVTAIKAGERLERMGDLARHIAELARLRHPEPVVPAGELLDKFTEMGRLAVRACHEVEHAIMAAQPCSQARERADDQIDRLHREVLDVVSHAEPPYPVRVGVDVALLARYLERFGDQAVSVTRRLDYVLTGELSR